MKKYELHTGIQVRIKKLKLIIGNWQCAKRIILNSQFLILNSIIGNWQCAKRIILNSQFLILNSILAFCLFPAQIMAEDLSHSVCYTPQDSARVVELLAEAEELQPENAVLFFARKFIGVPYVAKTLDRDTEREWLVVNLTEMDCTTFVETAVALARTFYNNKRAFSDFVQELAALRYEQGKVAYESRNHYFTGWIASNTSRGAVAERDLSPFPFAKKQHVEVNYMSRHSKFYPQLVAHPALVQAIGEMECRVSGGTYSYVPKTHVGRTAGLKPLIGDGDIIVITTSKAGLDCSHIGFAVWRGDGLHLLNASQIHGKVIEEPMTLYNYMKKHPTQTGIRAVKVEK